MIYDGIVCLVKLAELVYLYSGSEIIFLVQFPPNSTNENYCKVTSYQEIGCTLNKIIVILLLASPEIPDCHHVSPSVPALSEIPAITNPPAWLSTRDAGVILLQNFPDTQKLSRSIIAMEIFLS